MLAYILIAGLFVLVFFQARAIDAQGNRINKIVKDTSDLLTGMSEAEVNALNNMNKRVTASEIMIANVYGGNYDACYKQAHEHIDAVELDAKNKQWFEKGMNDEL